MSAVQWPWPSDRIHELEAENLALREQVKRLEGQKAAVWALIEGQGRERGFAQEIISALFGGA